MGRLELLERRTKLLNQLSKGISLITIVEDLSQEYKVSKQAIYKDSERLQTWAPQIIQLKDSNLAYSLVNNIKQVIPNAWYEYTQADNSAAKVGALRLIMDATTRLADLLQSLGMIPSAPLQIKHTGEPQITVKVWRPDGEEKTESPAADRTET